MFSVVWLHVVVSDLRGIFFDIFCNLVKFRRCCIGFSSMAVKNAAYSGDISVCQSQVTLPLLLGRLTTTGVRKNVPPTQAVRFVDQTRTGKITKIRHPAAEAIRLLPAVVMGHGTMKASKRSVLRTHLLATCVASLPLSAMAQDAGGELEPIIVRGEIGTYFENSNSTALKGNAPDSETPFQVTTTNQSFMSDIRARNLEDIFDYSTGITRSANTADGFTIRGFDIDLNNIKVDGLSGLTTRFGSPSTANVEKVEVLKGPASVLYGNMETGGMVNIVTKKPAREFSGSFTTAVQTYAGGVSSFGKANGIESTLDLTGPVAGRNDLFYRFILAGDASESFRKGVNNQDINLYSSILWDIDDVSSLSFGIEAGRQNGDADHGLAAINNDISTVAPIDTVYQDPNDFDNDKGYALTASYERELGNGELHLDWRSVWHKDERKLFENNRVNDSAGTLRRRARHQKNTRDWHGFDAYVTQQLDTGNVYHDLTFGLSGEYRLTDFDRVVFGRFAATDLSIANPVLGGTATEVPGNRRKTKYTSVGLYAQDKISLSDALTVVASGRVNRTQIDYTCVSGRCNANNTAKTTDWVGSLGAVYQVNDRWTTFGSIAQSFDPYTAERVDVNGNPLASEKSLQFEVGAKYQLQNRMNVTLSAYRIVKDNVSESLGGGVYQTVGQVESKGAELDLQWQPSENWQFKAGYAYNDSKATQGALRGLTPAHAPKNSAFVFTRYNLPQAVKGGTLGFSAGLTYRDSVKTDISASRSVTLPSYVVADVGVHFEKDSWTSALTVSNLFNRTYYAAGSRDTRIAPGEPRKLTWSITKSF